MTKERRAAERLACKGFGALLLLLAGMWAVPQLWDKLSPFIIAVPLAAALQPVVRFMHNKLKFRRSLAVLICVLILVAILLGITYWLVVIITEQTPQLVGRSGTMLKDALDALHRLSEQLMTDETMIASPQVQSLIKNATDQAVVLVTEWGSDLAASILAFTMNLVTSLPYGVIYLSFLAMALYFIAHHYSEIRSYLPGGKRRRQDSNTTQLTNSAVRSLMGYLRVQGTFALMVFVVSMIFLRIFGFRNATLLALVAGLMEMIPMIGSGLLFILMSIVYFLTGQTAMGLQTLGLTGGLQLLRRVLEPKLMSDSIGISPLESLIGMFVGMRFGGILGLIGGPVLMSVLVGAVRGGMLKSTNDDLFVIIQWFRKRWSNREQKDSLAPVPELADAQGKDGETDKADGPQEVCLQKEKDGQGREG